MQHVAANLWQTAVQAVRPIMLVIPPLFLRELRTLACGARALSARLAFRFGRVVSGSQYGPVCVRVSSRFLRRRRGQAVAESRRAQGRRQARHGGAALHRHEGRRAPRSSTCARRQRSLRPLRRAWKTATSSNACRNRGAPGTPGSPSWAGETDINSCSIGIEIANPGHDHGYPDFPQRQIAAVIALCRSIFTRHRIPADRVLAHSDVAPVAQEGSGREISLADRCTIPGSGCGSSRRRSRRTARSSCWATRNQWIEEAQALLQRYGYGDRADRLFRRRDPRRGRGLPAPLPPGPGRRRGRRLDRRDA